MNNSEEWCASVIDFFRRDNPHAPKVTGDAVSLTAGEVIAMSPLRLSRIKGLFLSQMCQAFVSLSGSMEASSISMMGMSSFIG